VIILTVVIVKGGFAKLICDRTGVHVLLRKGGRGLMFEVLRVSETIERHCNIDHTEKKALSHFPPSCETDNESWPPTPYEEHLFF
jgi:hypothetical protein